MNQLLLVFLMYLFFSSVSVLLSPTCLFCIVCWFHLFRLYIVYWLIIPFSAELILYRRRFVYLLIYWLCSIHLSLYFCTHFVLFSHLSSHLFIYRLFVRLFISSFHCILFIVHVLFHFRKAGLIIDYSFFIYGILSVTPFRFNRQNILTDFGIYLSESL